METISKLSFGVRAVVAGQKSSTVNALPQLIANSTLGKFVISAPVSKALNIAVGENIMFLNNISNIEEAIQAKGADVLAAAEEMGVDLNTREGADEFISAYTQWFIAKGVPMFDKTGTPVMTTERYTKEDKQKVLDANRMSIVEANREALVAQFGELSDEELAEKLTIDVIKAPEVQAAHGSKTATTASATGVGCQLNFTDTSIWNTLKADLTPELREKKNRVYDVKLDEIVTIPFNNGYEDVNIAIAPISFVEDTDPIQRASKKSED